MSVPERVRLFHITAESNVDAIFSTGGISCKNVVSKKGASYQNIAYQGAQGKRAAKTVPIAPGGRIHDYVPFYFAPRSPMLYAIINGRVDGCALKQSEIIYFETEVDVIHRNGHQFVFFDMNATLDFSAPYNDLEKLDEIAWELIFEAPQLDGYCMYWQNKSSVERYAYRMEKRQAEFLVWDSVPLKCFTRLGVFNESARKSISAKLKKHSVKLPVEITPDWYY